MNDLIERIEAASGPDREIDVLIAIAIGAKHGRETGWANKHNGDYYVIEECAARYTESVDAALTLVPEGCGWIAGWGQTRIDEPMGGASISRNARFIGHRANYDTFAEAEAATPALALCAAALKARAYLKETSNAD